MSNFQHRAIYVPNIPHYLFLFQPTNAKVYHSSLFMWYTLLHVSTSLCLLVVVGIGLAQPNTLGTSALTSTWDRICSSKYTLHTQEIISWNRFYCIIKEILNNILKCLKIINLWNCILTASIIRFMKIRHKYKIPW